MPDCDQTILRKNVNYKQRADIDKTVTNLSLTVPTHGELTRNGSIPESAPDCIRRYEIVKQALGRTEIIFSDCLT